MKKFISILLVLVVFCTALASCGITESEEKPEYDESDPVAAITPYKTLGELLTMLRASGEPLQYESTYDEEYYIYAFKYKGVYYRVIANMSPELYAEIEEIDFFDEERDAKIDALIAPLEIAKYENLTLLIPTQEEMDKLVGKTGEELFNDGWYCHGYDLGSSTFYMAKGMFEYKMVFDATFDLDDEEFVMNFNEDEDIKPLKVKSVEFSEISNATDIYD